ncbi:MAG: ATPase, T2SS/T4P/T4SS family [Phycisphaerae bacterium]
MDLLIWSDLLAQVPTSTVYIQPFKLLGFMLLFSCWIFFAQWVDKDCIAVNTFRTVWNMGSVGVGAASLLILILVPDFLFAALGFVVINLIFMFVYVNHRNGLVVEENRVLTQAHLQKVMTEGFGGKKKGEKLQEVKELVKISGADKKVILAPTDSIERAQYALAQQLMFDMLHRRAQMLDLIPAGEATRVRLNIDGIVEEQQQPMARVDAEGFLLFMKRAARLNLEERRKPQKGLMMAQIGETKFDLMIRTTGSNAGEQLHVRVLGPEKYGKVVDLGFSDAQIELFRDQIMFGDKGLVLVTALPGHGLTTTMYALARSHDAFLQNIQMLETEHEFDVENITQKAYVQSPEHTFSAELLKILRADPNVVLVPDLRNDKDAAKAACDAAARKQIVYVAMPAIDVFDGLARLVKLVGDPGVVAKSLAAITHQRLTRKLCESCKFPYKPAPELLQKINLPADRILHRPPDPQFDKRGNPIVCQGCQGTGYVGRTAIFTILVMDDDIRGVIKGGGSIADVKTAAAKKGTTGMQQHGLVKVLDGLTSIDEMARAIKPPQASAPKQQPPPNAEKAPVTA